MLIVLQFGVARNPHEYDVVSDSLKNKHSLMKISDDEIHSIYDQKDNIIKAAKEPISIHLQFNQDFDVSLIGV